MTGSLKDVSSAEMIRAMNEMQCFAHEYILYGYAWLGADQEVYYRMSENALDIRHSFQRHLFDRVAVTPILTWKTRAQVREEEKDDMLLYFKLQLANELRHAYPDAYFNTIAELQALPSDILAEPLMKEWQEELDGYFDEAEMELFAGALELAYQQRHLSEAFYRQMEQWVRRIKKQMMHTLQLNDTYERMFYGTALRMQDGSFKYLVNANEEVLYQQIDAQKNCRTYCPIYHKKYVYHDAYALPSVKKQFEADLKSIMNETYLDRMRQLQDLPSIVSGALWEEKLAELPEDAFRGEAKSFWESYWNV